MKVDKLKMLMMHLVENVNGKKNVLIFMDKNVKAIQIIVIVYITMFVEMSKIVKLNNFICKISCY